MSVTLEPVDPVVSEAALMAPPSTARVFLRSFWSRKRAVVGLAFLAVLVVLAVFAPLIAPQDPNAQDLLSRLKPPSTEHWIGTDGFGRDSLSRLIYGARVSLVAALISVSVGVGVGLPLGIVAGYRGGWFDVVLSRMSDGLMSIPALILAFTVVAVLGPGLVNAMLAVGIVFIPQFFRVARAATQDVRHESFIESSIALGCRPRRVVVRHVVPNVLPPVIVQMSVALGLGVSAEASLSFLGLGVAPPTASWGSMLNSAAQAINIAPFAVIPPGLMIFLTVLAFMFVGDGLQVALRRRSGARGG